LWEDWLLFEEILLGIVLMHGSARSIARAAGRPHTAGHRTDVAWVRNERLATLTDEEWHRFLPLWAVIERKRT
jgi:hypothetical protein